MVFGPNLKMLTPAKNDSIRNGISRGAEWCKFRLHSTFLQGAASAQCNLIETVDSARIRNILPTAKNDTIRMGTSREAELHEFQFRSTFQRRVTRVERYSIENVDYNCPWFSARIYPSYSLFKKERTPQDTSTSSLHWLKTYMNNDTTRLYSSAIPMRF